MIKLISYKIDVFLVMESKDSLNHMKSVVNIADNVRREYRSPKLKIVNYNK